MNVLLRYKKVLILTSLFSLLSLLVYLYVASWEWATLDFDAEDVLYILGLVFVSPSLSVLVLIDQWIFEVPYIPLFGGYDEYRYMMSVPSFILSFLFYFNLFRLGSQKKYLSLSLYSLATLLIIGLSFLALLAGGAS